MSVIDKGIRRGRRVKGNDFLCLLCLLCLLSGCDAQPQSQPSDIFGPFSATGTITNTGTSLYRRGTHVLKVNDRSRFYLESKEVNLHQYIDEYVVVDGEMEPNSHSRFLPVIRVQFVRQAIETAAPVLQKYDVPSLALSLEAISKWGSDISGGRLRFSMKDENAPFLIIEHSELDALPEGIHIRLNGRNGVRFVDEEANQHRVYIQRDDGSITLFTFVPQGEGSALMRDAFYTMLKSVEFEGTEGTEDTEVDGSGQPCGGPAVVLCPEGEYCSVKELDTGIGVCRTL